MYGGGIYLRVLNNAKLEIKWSTFFSNSAPSNGAAVYSRFGSMSNIVKIENSTLF